MKLTLILLLKNFVKSQLASPFFFQCTFFIILTNATSLRFPIWQQALLPFYHRKVQPDHEPQGAQSCGVTGNLGCIPLPASHSISGLLSSSLLCPCHMYTKQRHRETALCDRRLALHSWPGCIEMKSQRLVVNGL